MVALLILGVVLAALAPEFYGSLRASATTNQRSEANGLAVAATEQLRSFPYDLVGYSSSATLPTNCSTTNAVILNSSTPSPVDTLDATATSSVGGTSFTVSRCLYWVASSGNIADSDCTTSSSASSVAECADAYKQSVVTVSWAARQGSYTVTQSSLIYPGAGTSYAGPDNETPDGPTGSGTSGSGGSSGSGGDGGSGSGSGGSGATPLPPTIISAADDSTSPTTTIDVTWSAPTDSPAAVTGYVVEYATSQTSLTSSCTPAPCYTSSPTLTNATTSWPATVASGTTYYFQVISLDANGDVSEPSSVMSAATTSSTGSCTISNLVVSPTSATENPQGSLTGSQKYFSLSVNASSSCHNVTVEYTTAGSTPQFATMTGSGTLTGTAGTSNTVWDVGNHPFTVYVNSVSSAWSPLTQVQVNINQNSNGH